GGQPVHEVAGHPLAVGGGGALQAGGPGPVLGRGAGDAHRVEVQAGLDDQHDRQQERGRGDDELGRRRAPVLAPPARAHRPPQPWLLMSLTTSFLRLPMAATMAAMAPRAAAASRAVMMSVSVVMPRSSSRSSFRRPHRASMIGSSPISIGGLL